MGGWGFLVHLLSAMIICSRIKIIHLASVYLSASLFAAKAIRSALSFLLFTKGGEQEGGDPQSVCKCVWREGQGALSAPVCLGSGVYVYGCLCVWVCMRACTWVAKQNGLRLQSDVGAGGGGRRAESLFWTCLRLKMSTWFSSAVPVSQALTQTAGLTTGVFMYGCMCVCVVVADSEHSSGAIY